MVEAPQRKRCVVAFATRERQYLWSIELPAGASVAQAIEAARTLAAAAGEDARVPWDDAHVGIFGEPCSRADLPREGDRIELYRALLQDPKEGRRERVRQARAVDRRLKRSV
jgi:putative ubiquitin-RnfH superfamily antitoxin RatB of RatAB toxin-antitoxin module